MATRAYLMVNVTDRFCRDDYKTVLSALAAIPEVKSVERVSGACDLLVKVESPVRMIFVANKIMSKEWVKRLYVLMVEPLEPNRHKPTTGDVLKSRVTSVSHNQTSSPPLPMR